MLECWTCHFVLKGYKKRALHPNAGNAFHVYFPSAFTSVTTRVNAMQGIFGMSARKRRCLSVEISCRALLESSRRLHTHTRVHHLFLYIDFEKGGKHQKRTFPGDFTRRSCIPTCVASRRNAESPESAQDRHRLALGGLVLLWRWNDVFTRVVVL